MTEISKEVLEAYRTTFRDIRTRYTTPGGREKAALAAALAVERNRWEQEVRERLEKLPRFDCEEEEGSDFYRTRSAVMVEYEHDGIFGDWLRRSDVLAIFGEAEPAEGEQQ